MVSCLMVNFEDLDMIEIKYFIENSGTNFNYYPMKNHSIHTTTTEIKWLKSNGTLFFFTLNMYCTQHGVPSHSSDVIMSAMASQINGVSIVRSTVCSDEIKENTKAPHHWPLCERWFTSQRVSNAENAFIWWRHHAERIVSNLHHIRSKHSFQTNIIRTRYNVFQYNMIFHTAQQWLWT